MEQASKTSNRLDAIDAERFEAMLASESFALLKSRIVAELERARADCESQPAMTTLMRGQGQVKAFRTALDLPAIILREMRSKK